MDMPGRTTPPPGSVGQYPYGMNGQIREGDAFEGFMSADFWGYDSRLGRRWEMDPLAYAWQSPYTTFNNNPIYFADPLGLEGDPPIKEGTTQSCEDGSEEVYTNGKWKTTPYYSLPEVEVTAQGVFTDFSFKKVAIEAVDRALDPFLISQRRTGLCGMAVLATALAQHDPNAYYKLVIDLYYTGKGTCGKYEVNSGDVVTSKNSAFSKTKTSQADWVLLSSMRNTENIGPYGGESDTQGWEGFQAFTTPSEVSNIAKQMGFNIYKDNLSVFPNTGGEDIDAFFRGLTSNLYKGRTVIMLVNADVLDNSGTGGTPNHYLIYNGGFVDNGDGTFSFKATTWGKESQEFNNISKQQFMTGGGFGVLIIDK